MEENTVNSVDTKPIMACQYRADPRQECRGGCREYESCPERGTSRPPPSDGRCAAQWSAPADKMYSDLHGNMQSAAEMSCARESGNLPVTTCKGFLKDAIKALRRDPDTACGKLKNYKGVVDGSIFIEPRQIVLHLPEGAKIGTCQRPLRAQTMQGERVALAQSEEAPAGTWMEFSVVTLAPGLDKALKECWDYAKYRFMGAWRNSGKGKANVEEIK